MGAVGTDVIYQIKSEKKTVKLIQIDVTVLSSPIIPKIKAKLNHMNSFHVVIR